MRQEILEFRKGPGFQGNPDLVHQETLDYLVAPLNLGDLVDPWDQSLLLDLGLHLCSSLENLLGPQVHFYQKILVHLYYYPFHALLEGLGSQQVPVRLQVQEPRPLLGGPDGLSALGGQSLAHPLSLASQEVLRVLAVLDYHTLVGLGAPSYPHHL